MDRPAIHAAEDFARCGYPRDVEALLIIELDGPQVEVDHLIERVKVIAEKNNARTLKVSTSEAERLAFWAGRKSAFPAVGRISPDYICMDGTIPRKALPQVLRGMEELSQKHGLRVANVFHAGDGNLHPLILFDATRTTSSTAPRPSAPTSSASASRWAVVLTGEHGVGIEKRDLMPEMFSRMTLHSSSG